ncbi:DNA repair exonuclease [Iocasia frigidifontis]|uniref:DNA repair exonuclease n=1 Tax=Iocasia fonsfrigidae TaxID=2682810 RepID=A0A8A7KF46_9FIRM|nr:DNA repair exonuclease [Iocasia fonsfrigidae]QTL98705.1 DNA repair exonuclease [Iocasia fonsfrigidae]
MQRISFIHTADLHLGSTINIGGKGPAELEKIFTQAVFKAFENICDYALEYSVDFVLLSGDIYDRENRSVLANHFFNKQCKRLAKKGIPVLLIAGNHDPLNEDNELINSPDNVYIFSSRQVDSREIYNDKDELIAQVSGCSYRGKADSRRLYRDYETIPGIWNIALLHTQLDPDNINYMPCSLEDLLARGDIHYWALGHIHQARIINRSINRAVAYPGIPQGRDAGEAGIKGALLVELIPDCQPVISFLPTSKIIYQKKEISINSIANGNFSDLKRLINNKAKELKKIDSNCINLNCDQIEPLQELEGIIVDWVLTGRGELSELIKGQRDELGSFLLDSLQKEFLSRKPFIWTRKITDRTGKLLDEGLLGDSPIFKEIEDVIAVLKNKQGLKDELLSEFGFIWTDKSDREDSKAASFQLDDQKLYDLIDYARGLIIEELLERRERA